MDRRRGNIVVSRRAVLEESRAEQRNELLATLAEGQILDGVVKNITDYGAFVDLGGLDGLLHVTDISWKRVNHPSDVLGVGQNVRVQVIRFNRETQRISLGMKQLEADPWEGVELKYPVGAKFTGRVTNITDYGAFVELEAGVEGLVHVSEMSWTKKNTHPGKIVSSSQEVEVMVLEVDPEKRRISLGLKQCLGNPWEAFVETASGRVRSSRARSATSPSSACSSGSTTTSTAWSTCPTSTGSCRRGSGQEVHQGRHGARPGARRRRREGAHLAGHQAARRGPVQAGDLGHQEGRPGHLHGQGGQCRRHRGRDHLGCHRASSARSSSPATATSSAPSASRLARRSTPR